jgi:hypothetical protein
MLLKREMPYEVMSKMDVFDNPFMHKAFVHAGEGRVTAAQTRFATTSGYHMAYRTKRSPFALGCKVAEISAHGYAPIGAGFFDPTSQQTRSAKGFSRLLDKLAANTGADLIHWRFFPQEAMEFEALKAWHATRWGQRSSPTIPTYNAHHRAFFNATPDAGIQNGGTFKTESQDLLEAIDAPLLGLKSKRRKELRRQYRRLAEMGAITLLSTKTGLDHQEAINAFLVVEASGWKSAAGTALAADADLKAYVTEFLPPMLEEGTAAISLLKLDDHVIAGMVTLQGGRGLFTWKVGMDEVYKRFSPGVMMMIAVSMEAEKDPTIDYIDSLAEPNHPMADHIWSGRRAYVDLFIPLSNKGKSGARALQMSHASKATMRRTAKKILRRA